MPTAEPISSAPEFDPELQAGLDAMGVRTLSVGVTPDAVAASRAAVAAGIPSFDEIAADPRFEFSERTVPGPPGGPDVGVLLAVPTGRPSGRPVLFTAHGGGLIMGNNRFGLPEVLDLAADLGAITVSVEYRLAPEHPFPAAHDDAYAALLWTARHIADVGGDPGAIVLHGGSAGGNLAAGLALRARDSGEVRPRGQVLLYPMLDDRDESPSHRQMRGLGVWDEVSNRTAWDCVLGALRDDPPERAAPARARTVAGLPPAYLEAGSAETFRDETVAYAQRMWNSGGDAELHVWPGAFHGFDLFVPGSTAARRARATRRDWINRLLS
ncbi:alpha/beta hydrolase [Saccharopolyspora cebuensis]|uniref:Alpha/beta hydrolase n=1 Tax=Saccharopolyspora cebuensis TaxID=418759 RepID=A0ABV4CJS0_9PSEU